MRGGPGTPGAASTEEGEEYAPQNALEFEAEQGLKKKRKCKETKQGAKIRDCIKAIGAGVSAALRKPALEKRSSGGKNKEREAGGKQRDEDDVAYGMLCVGRPPSGVRGDSGWPEDGKNKDKKQRCRKQGEVQFCLSTWGQSLGDKVRVEVAAEEEELEDEHVGGPDGGRSAEPRQDVFADDELDLKEQKSAEKDSGGKQPNFALRRSERGGPLCCTVQFGDGAHSDYSPWVQIHQSVARGPRGAKFMRHR